MIAVPALWMLLGALLVALLPGKWLRVPLLLAPLLSLYAVWQAPAAGLSIDWLGLDLQLFESSPLRQLFATVFSLMAAVGGLYAMQHSSRRELAAGMAYAGGAIGVCFAGDLLTFFIFWELMAIFSTLVIWSGGSAQAQAAGLRYALLHFFGGVVLMAGIAMLAAQGSLEITALDLQNPAAWLVLIGVLINAAAPPLGAWVPDAYPEASAGGAVMLSAFTTKTSVLALILLFPGAAILTVIGPLMVLYGMGYALLSNDIRRLLAYSIVGQVGFMVTAVGVGTELARAQIGEANRMLDCVNPGRLAPAMSEHFPPAHAFTHILYKGLLMMSAGAVILQTGERLFTGLGGVAARMPYTAMFATVGALTIAAVPFTSGYVSKSLISTAIDQSGPELASHVLAFASAAAMVYVGLRFPWFVFFARPATANTQTRQEAPLNMQIAMALLAIACVALGLAPTLLFSLLPYAVEVDPYSVAKLASTTLIVAVGALVFVLTRRALQPRTISITDTDWLYRVAGRGLVRGAEDLLQTVRHALSAWMRADTKYAKLILRSIAEDGWLGRSLSVGGMISLLVGLLLLVVVLI